MNAKDQNKKTKKTKTNKDNFKNLEYMKRSTSVVIDHLLSFEHNHFFSVLLNIFSESVGGGGVVSRIP